MKKLFPLLFISLFALQCEKGWLREIVNPTVEGCNIPTACNYNPDVNKFDGSCEYKSCIDCKGMMHGVATIDSCGTCDAVPSNDCVKDCEDVWGGSKMLDCNGICDGTNLPDRCNVCDIDPSNDCVSDCAGVWGGSAVKDECEICGGDGNCECVDGSTSCECCCSEGKERDCFGACDGSAVVDQCDVCDGDNACLAPDLFSHNQSTLFAYYFVFSAYDYSGEYLEANQDWIGVFNGDLCVGAKLWSGGPTEVPAYGNDGNDYSAGYLIAGDIPTFKIYDSSENQYSIAITNEDFIFQSYEVNNILRMDVYVDCLGDIGGTAVIDICGVCNGDGDCEGVDCSDNPSLYCKDLSVLQILIDNSMETINMYMDDNGDGIIAPLELGKQSWENGRLISFKCYWSRGSTCGLSGEIPPEIGNLTNLQYLDLNRNNLSGEIPSEIGNLSNLQIIWLNFNELIGEIPSEIGNLVNLVELSLAGNQLSGEIPSEIGNLTKLERLQLATNQISGEIPSEIGNLINLRSLYLAGNQISGEIPSEIGNLINLTAIELAFNQITGEIPMEFSNIEKLVNINFYNNQLSGSPFEMIEIDSLFLLNLAENEFSGHIPFSICDAGLMFMWLDNNKFCPPYPPCIDGQNQIPHTECECPDEYTEIDDYCYLQSDLNVLQIFIDNSITTINMNMDDNGNGVIEPLELGEQEWNSGRLINLNCFMQLANHCLISGEIPPEIGNLTKLETLLLHYNHLSGEIPSEIGNLNYLISLYLSSNELIGEIPSEIGDLKYLQILSLYNNQLDGEIPVSIGNLINLSSLSLFGNQLTGNIPESICLINNNFNYLNISNNFLCPPYPTCIENDVGTQDTSNCP